MGHQPGLSGRFAVVCVITQFVSASPPLYSFLSSFNNSQTAQCHHDQDAVRGSAGGDPTMWAWVEDMPIESNTRLAKIPGLQGPIDDAFMGPFLIVLPDPSARDPLR